MRIAYVTETYPPELNGVALTVERTVDHLRSNRHPVLLIRPQQPGEPRGASVDEWRTAGLPIPMYPDLRFGLTRPGRLARRLAEWRPQLVHVATPGPLGWAAMGAAHALGCPATADFRTNFHQYSHYYGVGWLEPLVRAYLRRLHGRSRCNFVPTGEVRDQLAAAGFENLHVVGRGVDTERFAPSKRCAATRTAWQAGDAPVLLYAGRLAAEKNVTLALRAFEALRRELPATRMIVVGDGPMRRPLEQRYPAARFVGVQRGDDLARHYASADLFLFPSLSDTFGNVVLEALASGLPVVAFRTAAAAEHVVDSASGALAAPPCDDGYIAACRGLALRHAGDPSARDDARARARATALANTWDNVLDAFENHLESTLHANQASPSQLACPA